MHKTFTNNGQGQGQGKGTTRGFTLIELLVVIAIIAILAAFLFPAMASARKRGQQTISMNNIREWGSAMNRSLGDFDGEMPSDGMTNGHGKINLADGNAWFNRLPNYMQEKPLSDPHYATHPPRPGEKSVWINPAVPHEDGDKFIKAPDSFLFCYAMNYFLSNQKYPTQPLSRVERLDAVVFMAEKADDIANCNPKYIRPYFGPGDPNADDSSTKPEDMENAAHFVFCDGHVELIKRKDFIKPEVRDNDIDLSKRPDIHLTFVPYLDAESN